jgi:transketolase
MAAASSITACAARHAAAMNGMALHGGIIPYSGMFLVFSDYCRPVAL